MPTDPATLQSTVAPNVFVLGDATNVPTSKAGSVAHFEGETLVANVRRFLAGEPLEATFDGHSNCFIETGFGKALLIDFNYDQEPLPGRFPEPHLGPLPLLRESRSNHIGKLMFQWVYWHMLLPGRAMPGISAPDAAAAGTTAVKPNRERSTSMSTMTLAGSPVEVDAEGFLQDPAQWSREIGSRDRAPRTGSPSSPTATGR